jgi:membrane protein
MRSSVRFIGMSLFELGKEIGRRWWFHGYSRSAAALAFYSLFSMVPILVIVTGLAATFIGEDRAEEGVGNAAGMLFDEKSGDFLRGLLSARPDETFTGISSIVGFFVLLFTASKVVVELRESLGLVFGRKSREGRHGMIIDLVMGQVIPILLVFALGVVLVISAVAAAALKVVAGQLQGYLPPGFALWELLQRTVPLLMETLLFAAILKWLPPNPPRFRSALVGASVACLLLAMLRSLIGFYFSQSSVTTAYGAAVTLVVVLLWIYFTIQIFFIGAETAGFMERRARPMVEEEDLDA